MRLGARRLRAAREALGLSRRRLAKTLGVDEGTVLKWERGRGKPRGKPLERFKAFLQRCHRGL